MRQTTHTPTRALALLAGLLMFGVIQAADPPRPAGRPSGAPQPAGVATGMVGGSATYRERIALSPEAVFEAVLEDISLADAPSRVIGRTRIDAPGQVPIRFAIAYDPARIEARRSYSVRATIRDGGRLAFTTDRIERPFIDGQPAPLQLVLRAVSAPRGNAGPGPAANSGTTAVVEAAVGATSAAGAPGAATPTLAPERGAARLGPLPATFGGVLPCADCQGIRQTLDLLAEGGFYWRSTYLGKPATEAPDDIGRWRFASDERTLLLYGGREAPVRFVLRDDGALRLLDLEGRPIQSSFNYELRRAPGAFSPIEPRATLRGTYVQFADAPTFTDCATGQRMPVAAEGEALALERAYSAAKQPPATPRLVLVEARIAQRMPMEGPGPRATLVVDKFLRLANPGDTCAPPAENAPLAGTRWRLTQLDGQPVQGGGKRAREAWLQFDAANSRIAGSAGCNTLTGGYTAEADALRMTKIAGTMMACAEGTAQERAFLTMLGQVQHWLVAGPLLELMDGEQRLLARFEASATAAKPR